MGVSGPRQLVRNQHIRPLLRPHDGEVKQLEDVPLAARVGLIWVRSAPPLPPRCQAGRRQPRVPGRPHVEWRSGRRTYPCTPYVLLRRPLWSILTLLKGREKRPGTTHV